MTLKSLAGVAASAATHAAAQITLPRRNWGACCGGQADGNFDRTGFNDRLIGGGQRGGPGGVKTRFRDMVSCAPALPVPRW
jgi:hypothetical protein